MNDKMILLIGGVFTLLLLASAVGFALSRARPNETVANLNAVSYTHLTLPTKRIV